MTAAVRLILRVLTWMVLIGLLRVFRGRQRNPSDGFILLWFWLALWTGVFGLLAAVGVMWCVPVFAISLLLLIPWTVARRVLIPLGMSRAARIASSLSGWTWNHDRRGGGLIGGAWALLRQRTPDRAAIARLEHIRDTATGLTAAQVLATGLLALARGDVRSARVLIESVEELGPSTTPAPVHALAREWLVADAAEHGDWSRAAFLARGPGARTRVTRLLAAVAERLSRVTGAPSNLRLWLRWAISPARRTTYPLVRRAAATPVHRASDTARERPRLDTSLRPNLYADALTAHVHALTRRPAGLAAADLKHLAGAWDRALTAPETRSLVMQRAAIVGARSGERALRDLSDTVAEDLACLAREADVPLAEWASDSCVLLEAQAWLRDELVRELEIAFDALQERTMDKRALSPIDEWREWLSLRAIHRRVTAMGGDELRHLAFPHVHATVCKLAVWMWNERHQYLMANAMFRWLLVEANAVGDAEAIDLQNRNWDPEL